MRAEPTPRARASPQRMRSQPRTIPGGEFMCLNVKTGVVALATIFAAGCGGSSSPAAPSAPATGFFITIFNMSFSPLNLHAPPGATVTVVNDDGIDHSVTSEANANAFTLGSVAGISFDTGPFIGTRSFALPSNAPNGTVIPFFCTVHKGTMNTPNGSITIDTSATPTSMGGGGGGGGGY